MATIRSYTTIEQSKVLAKILPLESADMHYHYDSDFDELESIPTITEEDDHFVLFPKDIRCWSLAALLNVIPYPSLHKTFSGWRCDSYNKEGISCILGEPKENSIDACVEMIIKLHELKLL